MPGGLYCLFIRCFTAAHSHLKYIYSTPLTSNRQTLLSDFTAYSSHSGGCHHHHFILTLFSPSFLTSILTLTYFCSLQCLLQAHVLPVWEQNNVACSKKAATWLHCCDPVLPQVFASDLPVIFNNKFKIQVLQGIRAHFLEASSYFRR